MSIEIRHLTANPCCGLKRRLITPRYIIVHSTGAAIPSKENLFARWNKSTAEVSVHAMVDADGVLITLPLNYRGWHVGPLGNGKTVGFEVCEGKNMAYLGGATIDTDKYDPEDGENRAWFLGCWKNALEAAAYMCRETGLSPSAVISHAEAHALGLASNHGDIDHWLALFGRTMDGFRRALAALLAAEPQQNTKTGNMEQEEKPVIRYETLSDIPNDWGARDIVEVLMDAGIIGGDGSDPDGNGDIIDLSHDQVRSLVFAYRGGAFDRRLVSEGFDAVVEE